MDHTVAEVFTGTTVERILQNGTCPVLMVNEKIARKPQPGTETELVAVY